MLKKLILIGVFIYAWHSNAQTPPVSTNHEIDSNWAAPNTTLPPCSSNVISGCIKDYLETVTPPTGGGSATNINIPFGQTTYAWIPGGALYCGTWSVSLLAEYLDNSGTLVQSSSISKTLTVSAGCPINANPPSGLGVTVK